MEQPVQVHCHLCGSAAKHIFAYARFNEKDSFNGAIYRGVCQACLQEHIDKIKKDKNFRPGMLLWSAVLLPIGTLLMFFGATQPNRIGGIVMAALAFVIPIWIRLQQRREAIVARKASDAQNEANYSAKLCLEDALHTSRQATLIPLHTAYAEDRYEAARIAKELSVSSETADLIKTLAVKAQASLYHANMRTE